MYCTLEILRSPGPMPIRRTCTFGIEGGRIGRSPENDWAIPGEYLHRLHATVRFYGGLFYIEKRGSNRVAVGAPDRDLKTDDGYPIKDGDTLYLDDFEIAVRVTREKPVEAPVAAPAPFDDDTFGTITSNYDPQRVGAPGHAPPVDLYGDRAGAGDDLSLESLLGGPRAPAPAASRAGAMQQSSVLDDRVHLAAPMAPLPAPPAPGGSVLDDDWAKTSFSSRLRPGTAPPPPAPASPSPRPPPPAMPPPLAAPPPPAPPAAAARGAPPAPPAWPSPAPAPPASPPLAPPPVAAPRPPTVAPVGVPATARVPAVPFPLNAPPGGEFAALLAAAGIDPQQLAAGEVAMLGRALRAAIAGTVAALQARSELRAQLRLGHTQGARADDNPLKSAANVDDALHEFFRRRAPGSAPLDVALQRALDELQWQQQATAEALRLAFDGLLARLGPDAVAEEADRRSPRGALDALRGNSRLWDAYVQRHGELVADRDEAFRRLFAADFAKHLDEGLARRRAARTRKSGTGRQ